MASKQCDPKNKSRNTSKISAIWKSITVQVVLLMVVFIAWAVVHISDHVPALNHIPASPSVKMEVDRAEQDRILAERRALQRENFFQEDIVPLIHEASRRNQKSMDQAIENIEGSFTDTGARWTLLWRIWPVIIPGPGFCGECLVTGGIMSTG